MWPLIYASVFLTALCFSLALVPLVKKFAFVFNVIDYPSARKIHEEPVPLLGGLGIYFSVVCTVIAGLLLKRFFSADFSGYYSGMLSVLPKLIIFLATSAIVVITGLLDDLYRFRPLTKLLFQIICGILTFLAGIKISFFSSPALQMTFTVVWIVACMNSFNLLDHMDGLSVGVALIAGAIFFLSAVAGGQLFIAALLTAFLGGAAGFLRYNFPPAKIFLGECGSSFIGYFLGALAIMGTYYNYGGEQSFLPVFSPLLIFALPFFDTLGVIIIRLRNRKPVFAGDTNHLSHRLVRLGMTRKQAVLFCYMLALACGMGALLLRNLTLTGGLIVLFQVVLILSCVAVLESSGRKNG